MGLTEDSYVAYCFDQAVAYLGSFIDGELDKANNSGKANKEQMKAQRMRDRVFEQYFGVKKEPKFASPPVFFSTE